MTTKTPSSDRSSTEEREVNGYYWERCRRTAAPLVVGALGLAALGVGQLLPLRHSAETDLRSRSQAALSAAGLAGITVDFTGQDGVLTGTVTSKDDARRALDIVRALDGVRVATSRLTVPGADAPGTGPTATHGTATSDESPSPSPEPSTAATAGTPGASANPSATTVPSLSPTGTPAPTSQAPTPPEPTFLQTRLRALPQITFAQASTQLTPAGQASVVRAAAVLKTASTNRTFRIDGYTDDLGDWDVNLALSKARAETVRQVLVANGVPAARLAVVGWSEEHPKAPNTSEANRTLNRRVEIVVR